MQRSFLYRLYPTRAQEQALDHAIKVCRTLWNLGLAQRREAWRSSRRCVNEFGQRKDLLPPGGVPEVWQHSLQDVLRRLDKSFRNFFRTKRGFPRFKGRPRYNSITYPDADWSGYWLEGTGGRHARLHLSKVGPIRIRVHRLPEGRPKTLTVKRVAGRWFAVLCCDLGRDPPPLREPVRCVGLDTGVSRLATLSDGTVFESPKPLSKRLDRLRHLQRRLSRAQRGSRSRDRARRAVATAHWRVSEARRDAHFQVANRLVRSYDLIAVEDLDYRSWGRGMLSRASLDTAPGDFLRRLGHKAEGAGVRIVPVDAPGTTSQCSGCGASVRKGLQERVHRCITCGLVLDRDINAARNILARALAIPQELRESTPGEMGGPWPTQVGQVPVHESGSPGL